MTSSNWTIKVLDKNFAGMMCIGYGSVEQASSEPTSAKKDFIASFVQESLQHSWQGTGEGKQVQNQHD